MPFSAIGAVWLPYLLGYNVSIAVWPNKMEENRNRLWPVSVCVINNGGIHMKPRMFLLFACSIAACGSDDNDTKQPMTRTFTVQVQNVAPWTVLKSAAQTMKTSGMVGPAGPGEAFEVSFTAGKGQAASFVTMLGESNDWFFAPGPAGIALYDAAGTPVSGDVTAQVGLWNAGTEIDEEPAVGLDTGPQQSMPSQGAPDIDPTVRAIGPSIVLADGSAFALAPIAQMIKATLTYQGNRLFTLRIENVSTPTTLHTSQGDRPIHVSPVLWTVHANPAPLFTPGTADRGQGLEQIAEAGNTAPLALVMAELSGAATPVSPLVAVVHASGEPLYSVGQPDRGQGLEQLAESGNPAVLAAAVPDSMVVNTPVGAAAPGPALPGQGYQFTVTAKAGDRLSFATMFGTSDDWFFGTPPDGLPLFDADGEPMRGDVTSMLSLFDAGTEIDEEPGIGPDTGPQQAMPDQGPADPIRQVREVPAAEYGRPPSAHVNVTMTPM